MADEAAIELVTVIANPSEAVRDDHEEQLPCTELEMQDVEAEGNTSSEEMGPAEKEIDAGTEHGIDGGMEQGTPNDTEQGLITVIANPLPESEATCDEHRQNTEHEPRDIVAEETASESMKRRSTPEQNAELKVVRNGKLQRIWNRDLRRRHRMR